MVFDQSLLRDPNNIWQKEYGPYPRNVFAMGSGILWMPFLIIAHMVTWFAKTLGFGLTTDGYSILYECAVGIASCFYSFIASMFLYQIARIRFSKRASFGAVLFFCTTSAWICYVIYEAAYSHAGELFTSSLVFWLILRYSDFNKISYKQAFLLGTAIGLATLVRWQTVLWGIIPFTLCCIALSHARTKKPILIKAVVLLGGSILVFSPQCFAWKAIYGKYLLIPQGNSFLIPRILPFFYVLFSNNHGMFFWHPTTLIAFGGVIWFLYTNFKLDIGEFRVILLGVIVFLLMTFVNGMAGDWWAGGSFGMRRMICTYPLLTYGLAALLDNKNLSGKNIFYGWLVFSVWNATLLVIWIFHLGGRLFPH